MILALPPDSVELAEWLATRIGDLRSLQPKVNIDAALRQQNAGEPVSAFIPSDDNGPAFYWGTAGDYGLSNPCLALSRCPFSA